MATLREPLQDILTKLHSIVVPNQEGSYSGLYARVWNNQLRDIREGKIYEWPRPAAFVELVSPITFVNISAGVRTAELTINIHLIHDYYNAEVTFEEDLTIFDLRDKLLLELIDYVPTGCGTMLCVSESVDNDHDNLYHYVLQFTTHFRDSGNSRYLDAAGKFIDTSDANLDTSTTIGGTLPPSTPDESYYIIPNNQY